MGFVQFVWLVIHLVVISYLFWFLEDRGIWKAPAKTDNMTWFGKTYVTVVKFLVSVGKIVAKFGEKNRSSFEKFYKKIIWKKPEEKKESDEG